MKPDCAGILILNDKVRELAEIEQAMTGNRKLMWRL
jgi:hypothetical protein